MITSFAPATIGNIGIGFDILGLALEQPGDEVTVRFCDQPGVHILSITGDGGKLPREANRNTAGVAALHLLKQIDWKGPGVELELHKKMPFGSGLGSSGASAVAAAVAVNELVGARLPKIDLLQAVGEGERSATGTLHPDNVAPSLLGGIVLVLQKDPPIVEQLPVPADLWVAVVYPHVEVLTKYARSILSDQVGREAFVGQSARIAGFIAALYRGDLELLGRCLSDEIIEPQRAPLIPDFYAVKHAALLAGALGASISGSGPSVFSLCAGELTAKKAGKAMQAAFSVESEVFVGPVNEKGAFVRG